MKDSQNQSSSYSTAKLTGLGMEVISAILAGALLGYLFDRWQGTKPTGLAVGMITDFLRASKLAADLLMFEKAHALAAKAGDKYWQGHLKVLDILNPDPDGARAILLSSMTESPALGPHRPATEPGSDRCPARPTSAQPGDQFRQSLPAQRVC